MAGRLPLMDPWSGRMTMPGAQRAGAGKDYPGTGSRKREETQASPRFLPFFEVQKKMTRLINKL